MKTPRKDNGPPPEAGSAREILKKIQANVIAGASLTPETRQACVEQLLIEGYSTGEIAQIVGVCDRTIRRDLVTIRDCHAVERDPEMVRVLVGQLIDEAENAIQRIGRQLRDPRTMAGERIAGELARWRIRKECVELLQRLEYLPTADLKIRNNVTHHLEGDLPDIAQLHEQLLRLEAIEQENGGDLACIETLKVDLTRVQIASQIEDLTRKVNKKENRDERTDTA